MSWRERNGILFDIHTWAAPSPASATTAAWGSR